MKVGHKPQYNVTYQRDNLTKVVMTKVSSFKEALEFAKQNQQEGWKIVRIKEIKYGEEKYTENRKNLLGSKDD